MLIATPQRIAAALALLLWVPAPAFASDGAARVPVRVVEGRLVVFCDLSTSFRRIPVNLFVDLDAKVGLEIHNRAAGALRTEQGGKPVPVVVHLPGIEITVDRREQGDEALYDEFTKYHSKELGENAVVGRIGSRILKDYHLELDLDAGLLFLSPPRERGAPTEKGPGAIEVAITLVNDLVWLPVRYKDGAPAAMAVTTSRFDSLVDRRVADEMGWPAADVGEVRLGDLDLARFVAFRPEEVRQIHPDGVFGTMGLNLLEHFRVEIDRVNRLARFYPTRKPEFPDADLAFFRAVQEGEAEPLIAYLERYPHARLSREAAERLLDIQLDEGAPDREIEATLRRLVDNHPADLRATAALDRMVELEDAGYHEAVIAAARIGIEYGREDRYPDAIHRIHALLGRVLFENGEPEEAWKHLLSAAFGIPDDGEVNLYLGLYYESRKRYQRAFSRFVQAVIKPESGARALEGLERVQRMLDPDQRISVDTIDRLIAGKVLNFGTATRYVADPERDTNRVVLCELFTSANAKPALAGALGNEGLLSHFPRDKVAMIRWHLPVAGVDPMVNEMATRRAQDLQVATLCHRIDGTIEGPGMARKDQRELLYERVRELVLERLAIPSDYALELDAAMDGREVRGALTVRGPSRWGLRAYVVLVEKGVLFPGRSEVVIHRMVGRASIAGGLDGVRYQPEDGAMEIPFHAELDRIAEQNRAYLDRLAAEGAGSAVRMSLDIDPDQVSLVAFLRDVADNRVLQAAQIDPRPEGESQ